MSKLLQSVLSNQTLFQSIESLYILKETYQKGRGDTKKIIAKIDSIILTLIDFKDKSNKIISNNKNKASNYTSFDDSVLTTVTL